MAAAAARLGCTSWQCPLVEAPAGRSP